MPHGLLESGMPSPKLLVGLGNPGSQYRDTRHNLGFMVIDALASSLRAPLNFKKEHLYVLGEAEIAGEPVMLVKPQTFMNRSGVAVSELCRLFEVPLSSLLVIVDDFNLPFGKLRLRPKGSDGGHNGLASIIESLGSADFPRLRVGIAKKEMDDPVAFVLSPFDPQEQKTLPEILDNCVRACQTFTVEGINKAMNRYN